MKLQIMTDDGQPVFTFRSGEGQMLSVGPDTSRDIANALHDAQAWLSQDLAVIGSVRADISACIGRIEYELGSHPAFTWAQTKLENAAAHLEAYAKGDWKEPTWPWGVALDGRGMIVAAADGVITNPRPAGK